jgi:hypothetical protein
MELVGCDQIKYCRRDAEDAGNAEKKFICALRALCASAVIFIASKYDESTSVLSFVYPDIAVPMQSLIFLWVVSPQKLQSWPLREFHPA